MTDEGKLIWAHDPRTICYAFFIRPQQFSTRIYISDQYLDFDPISTNFMDVHMQHMYTALNHSDLFNLWCNYFPLFAFISFYRYKFHSSGWNCFHFRTHRFLYVYVYYFYEHFAWRERKVFVLAGLSMRVCVGVCPCCCPPSVCSTPITFKCELLLRSG